MDKTQVPLYRACVPRRQPALQAGLCWADLQVSLRGGRKVKLGGPGGSGFSNCGSWWLGQSAAGA